MAPRSLTIPLSRALPPAQKVALYQRNPVTLVCELEEGEDIEGAVTVRAEIRASQASETILAYEDITIGDEDGPYEFEFTTADMDLSIRSGNRTQQYWLEITAIWANDSRRETLAVRCVTLHRTSNASPTVPTLALAGVTDDTGIQWLRVTSGTDVYYASLSSALPSAGTEGTDDITFTLATDADSRAWLRCVSGSTTLYLGLITDEPDGAGSAEAPDATFDTDGDGILYLALSFDAGRRYGLLSTTLTPS